MISSDFIFYSLSASYYLRKIFSAPLFVLPSPDFSFPHITVLGNKWRKWVSRKFWQSVHKDTCMWNTVWYPQPVWLCRWPRICLPMQEMTRDMGSIPGSGRSLGVRDGNLHQYSCLGNSCLGQRSLVGYSPQGHKESDTT